MGKRLALEALESRFVPALLGVPWIDPRHLTVSFVPDGTPVSGLPSNLQQTLDLQVPGGAWRLEMLRALQTWAVRGNVNIGLVADSGSPLGTAGAAQGDSRFGDIRIAARAVGDAAVATGNPFQLNGSTWSGDVVLNSAYRFGVEQPGAYDLFSVALHEAGHAFGLPDDPGEPDSVMFSNYNGAETGLRPEEISAFQSLYGIRQGDSYEGARGNATSQTASALGSFSSAVTADITSLDDVDWYRIAIPGNIPSGSTVYAQLRTAGISLLAGSLAVFNGSLKPVGSATASSPLGNGLSVAIENASPGAVYYLRVSNATQSVFGIGGYQLALSTQADPVSHGAPAMNNGDIHRNDSFNSATRLSARAASPLTLDYGYQGSISDSTDVDYYRVHSLAVGGATSEMVAIVSASEWNGLAPRIDIYDPKGTPLACQVVGNSFGFFSVQLSAALSDTDYLIKVSARTPDSGHNTGNYLFGVNFNATRTIGVQAFASGALTSTTPQQAQTLNVAQASAFQFILTADAGGATNASVQMAIFDSSGNLMFWLESACGQPATTGVAYLVAGTYSVRYRVASKSGVLPESTSYTLQGWLVSDPIGPELLSSTTTTPTAGPPPSDGLDPFLLYQWSSPSYLTLDPWPIFISPLYY